MDKDSPGSGMDRLGLEVKGFDVFTHSDSFIFTLLGTDASAGIQFSIPVKFFVNGAKVLSAPFTS